MSVHRPLSAKVSSAGKAYPIIIIEPSDVQAKLNTVQTSPSLAFDSGPACELKPFELDLKNLPVADSPELDDSLRNLLMETRLGSGGTVNDDNDDSISEISTCSSVFTLETVDEGNLGSPSSLSRQTTSKSSSGAKASWTSEAASSFQSSFETEEEDSRKTMKRPAKKISDLFTFNMSNFNAGNGVNEENDEPKQNSASAAGGRRRKLSITRKISPLSLHGLFAGNASASISKQESVGEKAETSKKTRKLSLTMFNKPSTEKERKRRNTDPQLSSKHQDTSIMENEENKNQKNTALVRKESQTKPVAEHALFKEEDVKIHHLIETVLRAHLLSMNEYKRETCDRVCKSICQILKTLVDSMKTTENDPQCKVVCQAYIGSVKDEGLFATIQTLWENDKDNFAAASFRNDSLFGFASVITTTLH